MSEVKTLCAIDIEQYRRAVCATLGELNDYLGFTLIEQAAVFGIEGSVGTNPAYLANKLFELKSRGVQLRCEFIANICTRLRNTFGDRIADMQHRIAQPHALYDDMSVKELILSGDLLRIRLACSALELV